MNNMMKWLKSNWLIELLTVVALAVIPTAWYFADGMRTKVREDLQKKVQADAQEVANSKVQYHLINVVGDKMLEKSIEPNKVFTEWYRAEWEKIRSRTGTVSGAALTFNKEGHEILIPDLFPDPQEFIADAKLRQFAAAYIRAHPELLRSINAGEPQEPAVIGAVLADHQLAETERIKNQTGQDPTDAEKEQIASTLRDIRLREYQRRAAEISVYAGPYVFAGVPTTAPTVRPSAAQCWDWQERYWIHQDICRAIAEANKGSSGAGIPASVVKRIVKISAAPAAYLTSDGQPGPATPTESGTDKAPVDFAWSITGRLSGPGSNNKWYDVRPVTVEVVVASQRIPEFFDALSHTNFMSVIDMDLFRVDPIEELKNGYYYGDESVVRAVLYVETIWLREWRTGFMPLDVRESLGLVEGIVADDGQGALSAPAPSRAPPPSGGDDDDMRPGRPGRRGGGGGGD